MTSTITLPDSNKTDSRRKAAIADFVGRGDALLKKAIAEGAVKVEGDRLAWKFQDARQGSAGPVGTEFMLGTVSLFSGDKLVNTADCDVWWNRSEEGLWFGQAEKGDMEGAVSLIYLCLVLS
jgi:hypothetical protein